MITISCVVPPTFWALNVTDPAGIDVVLGVMENSVSCTLTVPSPAVGLPGGVVLVELLHADAPSLR